MNGFFGVDFYNPRMYPDGCRTSSSSADVTIIKDGKRVYSFKAYDYQNYGYVRDDWTPGNYQVIIQASWLSGDVRDYAFRTFLPSAAKFDITTTAFNSVSERMAALGPALLLDSLKVPYDQSDSKGFSYKFSYLSGA